MTSLQHVTRVLAQPRAAAPRARCFRALSHGLRGLARAQVIVDAGLPAEVRMVGDVQGG